MKIKCTYLLLILASIACKGLSQSNEYFGYWEVKEVKFKYIGSELSQDEANNLVGDTLSIADENTMLLGEKCSNVNFTFKEIDIDRYLYIKYKDNINSNDLNINEKFVDIMTLSCNDNASDSKSFNFSFLVVNKNKLILEWKEFIVLERIQK